MKKLFLPILFTLSMLSAFAQEEEQESEKKMTYLPAQPDLPGTLVFNFSFNLAPDAPEDFGYKWALSRNFSFFYQYETRIGESHFSFHPGVGVSVDKFGLTDKMLVKDVDTESTILVDVIDEIQDVQDVKKTYFSGMYVGMPLELRWHLNPNYPRRSFKVGLGVRGGVLVRTQSKVKYERTDGDVVKQKDVDKLNLARFRYGVYGRVGVGSFSAFYYYNISPLFEGTKGPGATDMTYMQVGVTYEIF